ncbi:MAG: FHA domain-containing protein [Gammaproteobacteria bacterium]|nr:FHA domain-containing protein [Gammaproteobacteria bacterium]
MGAVMLIEQLGPHGHPVLRLRIEGAGTECRIGRDLGCDIVVDDEHAAPQHALLTLLEDGRVNVRDLGTQNGTRVDGTRVPADAGAIIEQGEIIVGRTRLRIRTRHVPIGTERLFRRNFVRRHRTLLAAAGVSACIAYGGFLQWLEAPSSMLRSITLAGLVVLGLIALWTGFWALMTKLNHGGWQVRVHVAIASICAAICAWGYWVAGLVAFTVQWSVLVQIGVAIAGTVALAAVYLHLREATHYGRRVALALAGTATLLIGAIAWTIAIGVEDGDVNDVNLGPQVRLGEERVVPNRDIVDYLAEVDELQRAAGRERQKSLLNVPLADD